jgi:hypothetical protein
MMLFALYLVLVDVPRFEDANMVEANLTQKECMERSGSANGTHRAMDPGTKPRYVWACGPMPSTVDHHEDMLHPV